MKLAISLKTKNKLIIYYDLTCKFVAFYSDNHTITGSTPIYYRIETKPIPSLILRIDYYTYNKNLKLCENSINYIINKKIGRYVNIVFVYNKGRNDYSITITFNIINNELLLKLI